MEFKVIISGFGGQGVLFLGKVLAQAAVNDGFAASWLPSYGPEMRGGTANCRIVITDGEISSPAVKTADALIALNRPSLDRFGGSVNGVIITDQKLAQSCDDGVRIIGTDVSLCSGGSVYDGLANMVMLGALVSDTGIVSFESIYEAVRMTAGLKRAEADIAAVEYGRSLLGRSVA